MDFNLVEYISGLVDATTQGKVDNFNSKRKYANENYKDKNTLEFNILLTENHYINFSTLYVSFPIKIKSKANDANEIEDGIILVNNFFAHWIKEIDIKRYGDDIPVQPLKTVEIYRYCDVMLKHMP